MLRSDALRNKIYLMSFNLTVVLSQLLNRGHHMYSFGSSGGRCTLCVDAGSQCRCVYKSSYSCWDFALKKIKQYESIHYIIHLSRKTTRPPTTTQPLSPLHHLYTHEHCNPIIISKNLNVYNFLIPTLPTVDGAHRGRECVLLMDDMIFGDSATL